MISVLYIDDEPALLDIGKGFLELSGQLEVSIEKSALRALARLSKETFDVVISDYQMPELNGLELLTALRARGDLTPFIIFTGRGREEVAIKALNLGADFYMQKSGDPAVQFGELENAIRQLYCRREAERGLARSQEAYRDLVEGAHSIIMKAAPDGTITYLNPYGAAFFGLGGGSWEGKNVVEAVFRDDRCSKLGFRKFIDLLTACPEGRNTNVYECYGVSGTSYIAWTACLYLDGEGGLREVLCIGNDVTPLIAAQQELARSYAAVKITLESIDQGVAVVDAAGRVERCNDQFARLLGLPAEVIGMEQHDLLDRIASLAGPSRPHGLHAMHVEETEGSYDLLELPDGRMVELLSFPQRTDEGSVGRVWTVRPATREGEDAGAIQSGGRGS